MPRRARLFVPGCLHHVMARGLDGMDIFADDSDRRVFCNLLGRYIGQSGTKCYGWSLLKNHYHLVLRTSDQPLAILMKPLNARYAMYFNKRHKRRGYLFQDRFKSIATQEQRYIQELIRYVHLNPIRAGICNDLKELDRYTWCGHSALMGTQACAFQDIWPVLRRFGKSAQTARIAYSEYLAQGLSRKTEEDLFPYGSPKAASEGP
ncbi:MAG: transposase, partial [Chitinivibrionales bacterium]|nr:transposase [Chitinivibrionales bacterium]